MMTFLCFHVCLYIDLFIKYKNKSLDRNDIYEIKQYLKFIDDLNDEGYFSLSKSLDDLGIIDSFKKIVLDNGEVLFKNEKQSKYVNYDNGIVNLNSFINDIEIENNISSNNYNETIEKIKLFCDWIGYKDDTAYIFLLRDTFLSFIRFKSFERENIFPWIINRDFLNSLSNEKNVDDKFRAPIYNCVYEKLEDYDSLVKYCREHNLKTLNNYPQLKIALSNLLKSIKQKNIVVIESGCYGTIPMLLKSLDDRIDIKMFTTIPYLQNIYKDKIFTKEYELIRSFETLHSQEHLFKFNSFKDGQFYINVCKDSDVKEMSNEEINLVAL